MTYKQIWKNEKDNKYANITSYIQKADMMKYAIHSTNLQDRNDLILMEMIRVKWQRREFHNNRDTKESKKYGCVCTCCHRNDLPWYQCVIFAKTQLQL